MSVTDPPHKDTESKSREKAVGVPPEVTSKGRRTQSCLGLKGLGTVRPSTKLVPVASALQFPEFFLPRTELCSAPVLCPSSGKFASLSSFLDGTYATKTGGKQIYTVTGLSTKTRQVGKKLMSRKKKEMSSYFIEGVVLELTAWRRFKENYSSEWL